jgi:hypothetical protein
MGLPWLLPEESQPETTGLSPGPSFDQRLAAACDRNRTKYAVPRRSVIAFR